MASLRGLREKSGVCDMAVVWRIFESVIDDSTVSVLGWRGRKWNQRWVKMSTKSETSDGSRATSGASKWAFSRCLEEAAGMASGLDWAEAAPRARSTRAVERFEDCSRLARV